jgi:hypothetical protein
MQRHCHKSEVIIFVFEAGGICMEKTKKYYEAYVGAR